MRYFSVHKEELSGVATSGEIFSDGEYVALPDDTETVNITLGYSVYEYDENGMTSSVEFYPVKTNTESFTNNEEAVLDKIKSIYTPENRWQNNNW